VERFVEKPAAVEARALAEQGGLWNSFVVVARLLSLLGLYEAREPALLRELTDVVLPRRPLADRARALRDLYARLAPRDFSRHLLAGAEDRLAVLPVPPCGWTDLGTPERLAQVLRERFMERRPAAARRESMPGRVPARPAPALA
jgi:mannose-1-phosphate guanylyltransferase